MEIGERAAGLGGRRVARDGLGGPGGEEPAAGVVPDEGRMGRRRLAQARGRSLTPDREAAVQAATRG
jgi:hypothetical protein